MGGVAVGERAFAVPRLEDGFGGKPQLFEGIVREVVTHVTANDLAELARDLAPIIGPELGVGLHFGLAAASGDDGFENLIGNAKNHATEHLHQAAIGVEDKPGIIGALDKPLGDSVVEPEIENGVHHSGHRELRARAAGHQQRTFRIAERLACGPLELAQGIKLLLPHTVGELFAGRQVGIAAFGRHREARRHRHAKAGHVGQIRALAAEQGADLVPIAGVRLSLGRLRRKDRPTSSFLTSH